MFQNEFKTVSVECEHPENWFPIWVKVQGGKWAECAYDYRAKIRPSGLVMVYGDKPQPHLVDERKAIEERIPLRLDPTMPLEPWKTDDPVWDNLPKQLIPNITKFCDDKSLGRLSQISYRWYSDMADEMHRRMNKSFFHADPIGPRVKASTRQEDVYCVPVSEVQSKTTILEVLARFHRHLRFERRGDLYVGRHPSGIVVAWRHMVLGQPRSQWSVGPREAILAMPDSVRSDGLVEGGTILQLLYPTLVCSADIVNSVLHEKDTRVVQLHLQINKAGQDKATADPGAVGHAHYWVGSTDADALLRIVSVLFDAERAKVLFPMAGEQKAAIVDAETKVPEPMANAMDTSSAPDMDTLSLSTASFEEARFDFLSTDE